MLHSFFCEASCPQLAQSCANAASRATVGSNAYHASPAGDEVDVVDEALALFRANVLFRNFEVHGSADRVLIYLTLFIHLVRSS